MKNKKGFPVLYPNAAGIDISSKEHYVAVNPAVDERPIRAFGSFTDDLHKIASWLSECKVDTVAMEATGIYWVSLYLVLEDAGFDVVLVNARHVKNVRGKKSDVKDAEWIRQLHSCGLLSASFQPDNLTRKLRSYMRHRKNMTDMAATHIHMMQKAMEQMNIKLQHVIKDITGKTGRAIINAILDGVRDPEKLLSLVDGRIRATKDDIRRSLEGTWKEEHLFELRQSFDLYHIYRDMISKCDAQIREHLYKAYPTVEKAVDIPKKARSKSNKNNFDFDATGVLKEITGVDVTEIFGITDTNAVEIISEVGTNMEKWPTAKHFTAWLNLAPNNKVSGGKKLSGRTGKKKNKAGQVFKLAAYSVQRSKNWLAAFFHRIKSRSGTGKAVVATARKIAVIFYTMLKNRTEFDPLSMERYNKIFMEQAVKKMEKRAQQMGFRLVPERVT